jgi:hypothetical protein
MHVNNIKTSMIKDLVEDLTHIVNVVEWYYVAVVNTHTKYCKTALQYFSELAPYEEHGGI